MPPLSRPGVQKKATGVNSSPEGAAVLRGFAIAGRRRRLGVALGDERVRLVGEFSESQQVVEAEAVRGLPPRADVAASLAATAVEAARSHFSRTTRCWKDTGAVFPDIKARISSR